MPAPMPTPAPPQTSTPTPTPTPIPTPTPPRSAALALAMSNLQLTMSAADYARLNAAIASSPTLTQRLNEQIGTSITGIEFRSTASGASFHGNSAGIGPIVIGGSFLTNLTVDSTGAVLRSAINDLIFVLGHEASHGQNAAGVDAARKALLGGVYGPNSIPRSATTYNATQFVSDYVINQLGDEALSNIRGWNDVVRAEQATLGVTSLTQAQLSALASNSRYSQIFLDAAGAYKPGYSNGALSLGMIDPGVAANVTAAIADQAQKHPSTITTAPDSTYQQFYAASAISHAARSANGRPIVIDFTAAKLLTDSTGATITAQQAVMYMIASGLNSSSSATVVVRDSGGSGTYTLSKTATGTQVTHTPVSGTPTVIGEVAAQVKVLAEPDQPTVIERWVGEMFEMRSITGAQIGQILGSTLGYQIAGDNRLAQIGASTVVGALGQALGAAFDASTHTDVSFAKALSSELKALPTAIRDMGVG